MHKKNQLRLNFFLGFISILLVSSVFSQELEKPTLESGFLCASPSFNSFRIDYNVVPGPPFNAGNDFVYYLSDKDGNFDNEINIGRSDNPPVDFTYTDIISLPDDTYGAGYRIRIKTTDPVTTSPPSDPFEAYYRPGVFLALEDGQGNRSFDLCSSSDEVTVTIQFNPANSGVNVSDYQFVWYLGNGDVIPDETGPSLTINQAGQYYAQIEMGQCTTSTENSPSNFVQVNRVTLDDLVIEGNNTVEICANESYDLVASINDPSYTYTWFKDDDVISGATAATYSTGITDQFGVYFVRINTPGGCELDSQNVTIQQQTDAGFTVQTENPLTRVLFPGDNVDIAVSVTPASGSYTYQWFKDGVQLAASSQPSKTINQPGEYYCVVTDVATSCAASVTSESYVFLRIDEINTTIRTDNNYEECNSAMTTLSIVGVKALASDGLEYDLTDDQVDSLNFQWVKDGAPISGATSRFIDVNSYLENGDYLLNTSIGLLSTDSNGLTVLLTTVTEIISSSSSNSICPGGTINLSLSDVITGFTYTWFKDDVALTVTDPSSIDVDEIGEYYVAYQGFGCDNETERIVVVEFDDSILEVTPSTTAVLLPGDTVVLSAIGADSYEWFNESGDLLSSNETLDVNTLGVYTLIGTVGTCQVTKEINVVEDDGNFVIPNILTPFRRDGINDTWELPNKFAFQSSVQVIIYNSRGQEILNTVDYQNNWPEDDNIKGGMLFYFKVIKENSLIKAGTISVLD